MVTVTLMVMVTVIITSFIFSYFIADKKVSCWYGTYSKMTWATMAALLKMRCEHIKSGKWFILPIFDEFANNFCHLQDNLPNGKSWSKIEGLTFQHQVGTDIARISLSEETTNILYAVMRMVNVKEMKMISAMRIIMSVMVTAMVTDKSIRFSWPGDRNHPRDWDPHHPLHLPLCEDQEGMRRWKVLEVRCHYQRVTWDICNFALVRQINVAKEKSDPEKQSNSPAWGFSNEKIPL